MQQEFMFRREHRFVASRLATVRTMTRSGRVNQIHGRRDLVVNQLSFGTASK